MQLTIVQKYHKHKSPNKSIKYIKTMHKSIAYKHCTKILLHKNNI